MERSSKHRWWEWWHNTRPLRDKYTVWREMAKAERLSPAARHRLNWMIYYATKGQRNVAKTCRYFGIRRKTFYHWQRRFDDANLRSLEDRSRAPHRTRRPEYTPLEAERVVVLRQRYPTAGRDKLVVLYEDVYQSPIKPWRMRRIVRDYRLYAKRAVRSRRVRAQGRVWRKKRISELAKQPRAGFLVEVDTIVIYWNGQQRYILTAVDYHSRLAFAYMYRSKASRNAADFLKRLLLMFGGRIENLHLDNGSEFKREFEQAAHNLGITLYHARPYRAQDKPVIERFNGIIQQEYINLGHFSLDVEHFNRGLVEWLIYYNFERPHHALGLKRPAEFANMKAEKVLPMYSPMTSY